MAAISVQGLTKRFGDVLAVDQLNFEIDQGTVAGFLGPNGAGKTTTLRMLLGLVAPTAGTATVAGRPYRELPDPARRVGAVLEASGFHPGRSARDHLRVLAVAAGIDPGRADQALELTGLAAAGRRRVGGFSLGMRQRLGLAGALLGDPEVLILDEPANGLDPEGIRWLRGFLRGLAEQGRTVFVSSHVLSEMAQLADRVVIIHRGRLISHTSLAEILARAEGGVRVRSPQAEQFRAVLSSAGFESAETSPGMLAIKDAPIERVGELAAHNQIVLHELSPESASLEEIFLELTGDAT